MTVNQMVSRDRSFVDLPLELYKEISTHLPYRDWGTFSEIISLSLRQVDHEQGIDSEKKPFLYAVDLIVLFKNQELANIALRANRISILILLEEAPDLLSKRSCEIASVLAASKGNIRAFKNFENKNLNSLKQSFYLAAAKGHLDILKLIVAHDLSRSDIDEALSNAISSNQAEVVKWMIEKLPSKERLRKSFEFAAAESHLDILKLIAQNDLFVTELNSQDHSNSLIIQYSLDTTFSNAISSNQTEVVRWMLANLPLKFFNMSKAYSLARGNNNKEILDILKNKTTFFQWLISNVYSVNISDNREDLGVEDLSFAALEGDLAAIQKILRENSNIPSSELMWAFDHAACRGNSQAVEILIKEIQEKDAEPLSDNIGTFCTASLNGHAEVVRLILEHDPNNEVYEITLKEALKATTHAEVLRVIMQSKQFQWHLDSFNNNKILTTEDLQRIFSLALTSTDQDFVNNLIATDPFHLLWEDEIPLPDSSDDESSW